MADGVAVGGTGVAVAVGGALVAVAVAVGGGGVADAVAVGGASVADAVATAVTDVADAVAVARVGVMVAVGVTLVGEALAVGEGVTEGGGALVTPSVLVLVGGTQPVGVGPSVPTDGNVTGGSVGDGTRVAVDKAGTSEAPGAAASATKPRQ